MKNIQVLMITDAGQMKPEWAKGKTVVVIDVLRATSVMLTAFQQGVKQIFPFSEVEEARNFYKQLSYTPKLLCGERNAERPAGFDAGNSPMEYLKANIQGAAMVMTTSNGTRAIQKSNAAKDLLIGSFLNLEALAKRIIELGNKELVLLCSGTRNQFSLDDAYCAAYLLRYLEKHINLSMNDLAFALTQSIPEDIKLIPKHMENCFHYQLLKSKGFDADLDYCFQFNRIDLVPYVKDNVVQV